MRNPPFLLLVLAFVLFLAAGAGAGPFHFGTVTLSLLPFALAAWVLALLLGGQWRVPR